MPSLPRKSVKGAIFKKWVVESIDAIIDYLSSNWLQPGNGINIRRTPSGTIVELQKQNKTPQTSGGGNGIVQDISATVSGSTAAIVGLSGSTSSVAFVAGSNMSLASGENGEIVLNSTGGSGTVGFPDLLTGSAVSGGTNYAVTSDSWLVGHVGIYGDTSLNYPTNLSGYVDLKVSLTATPSQSNTFELYCNQGLYQVSYSGLNEWFPVCIPIKAGYTIRLTISGSAIANLSLYNT